MAKENKKVIAPITRIIRIGIPLIILIFGLIIFLLFKDQKCARFNVEIFFGRSIEKSNNDKTFPKEIETFISDLSDKCPGCYFPDNSIKLISLFKNSLGKSDSMKIDTIQQLIRLYSGKLNTFENKRDLPEINYGEIPNNINDKFFSLSKMGHSTFVAGLKDYIKNNNFSKSSILIFSQNQDDSLCNIVIDKDTFEVITNIDTLVQKKGQILETNNANGDYRILLVFNPPCNQGSIKICHKSQQTLGKNETLEIPEDEWPEHEAHGDKIGECPPPDSMVYVCCKNFKPEKTQLISKKLLKEHLGHGDKQGGCPCIDCEKIIICHHEGEKKYTLVIKKSEWPQHQAHGDEMGECPLPPQEKIFISLDYASITWTTKSGRNYLYNVIISSDNNIGDPIETKEAKYNLTGKFNDDDRFKITVEAYSNYKSPPVAIAFKYFGTAENGTIISPSCKLWK